MIRDNDSENQSRDENESLAGIASTNEASQVNIAAEEEISDAENIDLEDDELDEEDFEVDEDDDDSEDA